MNTTHLFVELLVIGFGALIWMLFLGSWCFGYDLGKLMMAKSNGDIASLTLLLPVLTIAYLLGIITDRVADWMFDRFDIRHRETVYDDPAAYHDDRRSLVHYGPALWTHFEYGRSRMRICRGWAVNSLCLLISFNLWVASATAPTLSFWQLVAGDAILFVLLLLCVMTWRELNSKEYKKIKRQAEWLKNERVKALTQSARTEPQEPSIWVSLLREYLRQK